MPLEIVRWFEIVGRFPVQQLAETAPPLVFPAFVVADSQIFEGTPPTEETVDIDVAGAPGCRARNIIQVPHTSLILDHGRS